MDVDEDVALGRALAGLLADDRGARKSASEEIERRRAQDPAALALALAGRLREASLTCEARVLAAVLLRQVFVREGSDGGRLLDERVRASLLEALIGSVEDPEVCKHAADAAAAAASLHFARGGAWPELALLLARWCHAGRSERAAVLRVLEQLGDDKDEARDGAPQGEALCSLLAYLEDHGAALCGLLAGALGDTGDAAARDAAARVFARCAADALPSPLQASLQELRSVVANAATSGRSEACLHALALATRADPEGSSAFAAACLPALADILADAGESVEVRRAAVAAAIELWEVAAVATSVEATAAAASAAARGASTTLARSWMRRRCTRRRSEGCRYTALGALLSAGSLGGHGGCV